ncbi:hypothetical protein CRUP_016366 [Coryphaenoides rupestris]|nr:hypothetical protein CRUP_016366 [Coryphaenoides rupestris]
MLSSSGVLDHQPHAGLQKLSALGALARSSLGPCRSYKFLTRDGEAGAVLAGSLVRLLGGLELSGGAEPVGQLAGEAVRAHHAAYGSGGGCLLFMAGAWSRAALEALRGGIPAPRVLQGLRRGLEVCSQACGTHSVSLLEADLRGAPRGPASSLSGGPTPAPRPPGPHGGPRGAVGLTRSRHFCGATQADPPPSPPPPVYQRAPTSRDIGPTARALAHGRHRSMELVLQASRLQSASSSSSSNSTEAGGGCGCSVFDISRVLTCVLPGVPEDQARVLPGCVVRLPAERLALASQLTGARPGGLRVVLIAGDLCGRYRHLGCKPPAGGAGVRYVTDCLDPGVGGSGREARWTETVLGSLQRLGVDLVLVSGAASESLSPRCLARHILLVDGVGAPVLRVFAEATGAVAVAYAAQLSERCVGVGVEVEMAHLGAHLGVVLFPPRGGAGGLVTAVLSARIPAQLEALEDEFWASARRLHHALRDAAMLPGAGVIETLCARDLRAHAHRRPPQSPGWEEEEAGGGLYRGRVLGLMADALMDYVATVTANSGRCSQLQAWTAVSQGAGLPEGSSLVGEDQDGRTAGRHPESEAGLGEEEEEVWGGAAKQTRVYDNLSVKVEAWRRALDLVSLVLLTDAEVITGVDPGVLQTDPDLMLL